MGFPSQSDSCVHHASPYSSGSGSEPVTVYNNGRNTRYSLLHVQLRVYRMGQNGEEQQERQRKINFLQHRSACHKILFLFPLVASSFAEQKAIIPVFKMMKKNSLSALLQLRNIVLPLSSITGTD